MTLTHDLAGTGPTVLLLHSGVCDRRMWDPQWRPLQDAGFRALRADFRGYGETPMPTGRYDEAEDVVALLDDVGADRAVVVGSSFGGRVAQEFAARWPDRVEKLVLVCPASRLADSGPEEDAFDEEEERLLETGDVDGAVALNVRTWVGPAAGEETRNAVAAMQRRAFDVQLAEIEGDPSADRPDFDLAAVTAPTLVVTGGHDLPSMRATAEMLAERIPDTRLVDLDWAGHLPSMEDPERFTPVLLEFLRRG